jgi:parallel beta-helix repeat protein
VEESLVEPVLLKYYGERKLKLSSLTTMVIIILPLVWLVDPAPSAAGPNGIHVPQDYPTIQAAIDAANSGDTIHVAVGTYPENLKIKKPLKLLGDGSDKTIISNSGTVVFVEGTNNVEIKGFTVQGGTYGIFLWHSSNIYLRDNHMTSNKWNFGLWGDSLSHFIHDIDFTNLVDGKPIYFLVNQHGKQVPDDAGYVALINSTNITAKNMDLTSNEQGIMLAFTTDSIIQNVTIRGNDEGMDIRTSHNNTFRGNRLFSINWRAIYLESSHNNTFYENTLLNGTYGVSLQRSNGNTFYHNNFIDNKDQVYREISQNTWHDETEEGNYWSDYSGSDTNGDGLGDTDLPWQEVDYHPLMNVCDRAPPQAHAGADQTVLLNSVVGFDAQESFDDVGIAQYLWDFGDGTIASGPAVIHTYNQTGNFTVTLTVIDLAGKTATDSLGMTVVEPPLSLLWWILIVGFGAGAIIIIVVISFWRYRSSRTRKGSILLDEETQN